MFPLSTVGFLLNNVPLFDYAHLFSFIPSQLPGRGFVLQTHESKRLHFIRGGKLAFC